MCLLPHLQKRTTTAQAIHNQHTHTFHSCMDCDTSSKTCRSVPSTQTPTHLDCHHHREHIFGISPSLSPQRQPTPAPCPSSALPTPPQNEPFQHSIVSDGTSFALLSAYIGNCACGLKNHAAKPTSKAFAKPCAIRNTNSERYAQ